MGIKLTSAEQRPGVTFDQVFVVRLVINQRHQDVHTQQPVFEVTIKYRTFGVDSDGVRHYSGKGIHTIKIDDWITHCVEHHSTEPPVLAAMDAIEAAIAVLIAEDRKTSTAVI